MYSYLSDSSLDEINKRLDWHSGITLPDGRLLGSLTRSKRKEPESIPDYRVKRLNDILSLQGKKVLEVGCFEGAHTLSFLEYTDDVTAIDVRPSNVINTLTRLSVMGKKANVFVANVEELDKKLNHYDLLFHCGVLYHLVDPVRHLKRLEGMADYILLDTHIASPEQTTKAEVIDGNSYDVMKYTEGSWADPFSGKDSYASWLTEESLIKAIENAGYKVEQNWETRQERNGSRICWLLKSRMIS